jgi:hypothetical protein
MSLFILAAATSGELGALHPKRHDAHKPHKSVSENPAHHPANELFDMKAEHDAAVVIQASFRGFQARKKNVRAAKTELSTLGESGNDDNE